VLIILAAAEAAEAVFDAVEVAEVVVLGVVVDVEETAVTIGLLYAMLNEVSDAAPRT
jgi:hypothetical protein